jgi:hypothetical protein
LGVETQAVGLMARDTRCLMEKKADLAAGLDLKGSLLED